MVESRRVSVAGSIVAHSASPALRRSRRSLAALLLASAAITTGAPGMAATLDLGGVATNLTTLDVVPGTNYDFVQNGPLTLTLLGNYTFGGVLTDGAGTLSLTTAGPGTLTLTGVNTYHGITQIGVGTIKAGVSGTLSPFSVVRPGGGTLDLNGTFQDVAGLSGPGTVANTGGAATIRFNSPVGNRTYSGVITETGGVINVIKTGPGQQTLNGNNTYSGGTAINQGILGAGQAGSLGTGQIRFSGSSILQTTGSATTFANAVQIDTAVTGSIDTSGHSPVFTGVISGNGTLAKIGTGSLEIDNTGNNYTGGTVLAQGSLLLGGNDVLGTGNLTVTGNAQLNAVTSAVFSHNVVLGPIFPNLTANLTTATGTVRLDGVVSGTGGVNVQGGATLILGNANTYSGNTQVISSTLGVANSNALSSHGVVVTGNSTLRAYAPGVNLPSANGFRVDGTLTVDTAGVGLTINGNINDKTGGAGALVVAGGGTLNVRGINNYSLGTTVTGGSVIDVNADNQLGAVGAGVTLNDGTLEVEGAAYTGTTRVLTLGAGGGTVQIDNAGTTFALASVTGAGGLSTFGPGTVELTGANSYTGGTSVAAGVLQIDNAGSLGTGTAAIANGATLRFGNAITVANDLFSSTFFGLANLDTNGNDVTLSGAVQGGLSFYEKVGGGTLTLSGSTPINLSGITVQAGSLNITGNYNNAVEMLTGTTLTGTGSAGSVTIDNGATIAPGIGAGGVGTLTVGTLALNSGSILNYDLGAPGASDKIIVSQAGGLTLDGTVNVNPLVGFGNGTYHLINFNGGLTNNGLLLGGAPGGHSYSIAITASNVDLLVNPLGGVIDLYWDGAGVINGTVDGGSGTWNSSNINWSDSAGNNNQQWNSTVGNFGVIGGTVTVVGTQNFDRLNFTVDGYTLTGGTLAGSAVARIDVSGGALVDVLSDISGASGLTKSGAGTLLLEGANTFVGLNVTGGTIGANGAGTLGTGLVTLANGTTLQAFNDQTLANNINISGISFVDVQGFGLNLAGQISGNGNLFVVDSDPQGSLTLAAGNIYTGGTTIQQAVVFIGADSALGTGGALTLNTGTLVTTADLTLARNVVINGSGAIDPNAGTTATVSGIVSGGTFYKYGLGTVVLGNSGNTYSGGTILTAGVLAGATNGAFGTGPITFSSTSTLRTDGAINFLRAFNINAAATIDTNGFNSSIGGGFISGAGSLTKTGAGELFLAGDSISYTGPVNLNQGNLRLSNDDSAGSGTFTLAGGTTLSLGFVNNQTFNLANSIVLGGAATIDLVGTSSSASFDGTVSTNGTTATFTGPISGSGPLTFGASGIVLLNGANTYSGGTVIGGQQGIYVGSDAAFGTGAVTSIGQAVILNDSGAPVTLANAITLGGTDGIGGNSRLTLTGVLAGTGTNYKVGTDTLVLTNAANTLGGNFGVEDGLLQVDGNLTNAALVVSVDTGGSLGGHGTIAGTVNVGGGTLAPGDSPGTLTVGGLTQTPVSTLNYEFGQAFVAGGLLNDRIIVTNNWTLDGTINVAESAGGSLTAGFYNIGTYGGTLTDNGLSVGTVANGLTAVVDVNTTTKQVNLIASSGAFSVVQYWDGTDQGLTPGIQGGNGTWDLATQTNWTDSTGTFNAHWQGDVGIFNAPGGTVTLAAPIGFNELSFQSGDYTFNGGSFVASSALLFGSQFDVASGLTETVNSTITGGAINKTGDGRLNLNSANTYTNGTVLFGGTLGVGNNAALGTGVLDMADGTTLASNASGTNLANDIFVLGAATVDSGAGDFGLNGVISGPGDVIKTGTGTLFLTNNANTFNGLLINGGTVNVNSDGSMGTGDVVFQGPNATLQTTNNITTAKNFNLNNFGGDQFGTIDTNAFTFTVTGQVFGGATLIKESSGRLVLTNSNTYTGGTLLNAGSIQIANGAGLGTGTLTMAPATTLVAGTAGSQTFTLGASNVVLTSGVATIDLSAGIPGTSVANFSNASTTTNGTTLTINGAISGAGALQIGTVGGGAGRIVLNGPNTYSGGTTVNVQNAVLVGSNTALGTGAVTLVGAGLGGGLTSLFNNSGSALTLANTINVSGFTGLGGTSNLTLAGALQGSGDIFKQGSATLQLTNAASGYSGVIDVNAGKLAVDGALTSAAATVTVHGGATLSGIGTIAGTVNVQSGGIVAPGDSPGTLTVGNINLATGSILNYELGQASIPGGAFNDRIIVTGNYSNAAGVLLNVTDSNAFGLGVYNLFSVGGTVSFGGITVNSLPGTYSGLVFQAGNNINLLVNALGAVVQYWDGADLAGNGVIDGGTGTWSNSVLQTNWTTATPSLLNAPWGSGIGIFAGTAGVVTTSGALNFQGLEFSTDGYVVNGPGTLNAVGPAFISTDPGVTTTINAVIASGSINKQNSGNLVLNAANTYAGGTTISGGTLTLGTNTAAGTGAITIGNGSILAAGVSGLVVANAIATPGDGRVNSGPGVFTLNGNIAGTGSISQIGTGNLVLNGNNSFAGGLGINQGTVTVGTNTAAGTGQIAINNGAILAAGVSGLTLANTIVTTSSGRINSGPGVFTLNGQISGLGSISQIGTGNLVLNGNNSFINLGINQGTVTVGTNTAAGIGGIALNSGAILAAGVSGLTLANNITTTGDGRINSGPGIFTLNGVIDGPGSISQIGTGNLVLNGNNSFTNLGINQGTVTVGTNTAAGIGGIALNSGAILRSGAAGLSLANAITTTGNGRIDTQAFTFTLNGNIDGPGSISQIGTGNLVLNGNNSFTNLGINQGTVTLGTNTAAGIGNIALNSGAILAAGADNLVVANNVTTTGNGRVDTHAFTFTLAGTIDGAGSISQIGTGNLVLNGNNSFAGGLGINQGTVTLGTNTAAGTGNIALNSGAILAAGANNLVVANGVTTTGNGRVDTHAFTFTLAGTIAGAGSISQIGTGNLVLNGNNSFAGGLGINQGTVTLGTNTAAGTGNIALNSGATLAAGVSGLTIANGITTTGDGRVNSGPGIFTLNGVIDGAGSISQIGTGNLVLNGNNSFTNLGINQGTVTLGTNTAAGIGGIALNSGGILAAGVSGLVIANGITTTGDGRINSGPGVFTLNGVIDGAGSISQIGTGNLVLNGANLYHNLGINQGRVTFGTSTSGGIGDIAINSGGILAAGVSGLNVTNTIYTTGDGRVDSGPGVFTLSGHIMGAGSISQIGTGNLILANTNDFAAGLGINQGKVTLGTNTSAGTGTITINSGAILAAGVTGLVVANKIDTTGDGRVDSGSGTLTLNGVIGNVGSISQIGTGNLILNGNNLFSAGLGINQGTVTLGSNTAGGIGTITLNGPGTLAAGVTGLTVANKIDTTGNGRIDSGTGTFTLSGVIGNVGGFTKVGSGNLVLTGASIYTGPTTVSAGALLVNGSVTSAVTAGSGGTIGGSGTIGSLNALAGSTVSPGASAGAVGTLSVTGNASFAAGSTYLVNISGTTSDRLTVGGTASLGGAGLSLNGGAAAPVFGTTYTLLTAGGGRTGTFTTMLTGFSQAFAPTVTYGANSVTLLLAPASITNLLGGGYGGSNAGNFAGALDVSINAGFNPQNFYPIFLQSGAALAASLNQLTGEITAADSRTAMTDTRYVREAALDRLGMSLSGDATTATQTDAHGVTAWARGIGSWQKSDADGNASHIDINSSGVVAGIDGNLGEFKVGALFNYIRSNVDTTNLGRGRVESTGGGIYAGYRGASGLILGVGGAASHVRSHEDRTIVVPGIGQSEHGRTSGTSYQGFGEVAFDLAASPTTRVEPFLRGAYVSYHVDGFAESGGFAALSVQKATYDTGYITAGVRGSILLGGAATLKGSAGYQYTTGDRAPISLVSLTGTTGVAAIRPVALDKSSFAGELGLDYRISKNVTLGAGYSGVIGKHTSDNGVKGTLTIGF